MVTVCGCNLSKKNCLYHYILLLIMSKECPGVLYDAFTVHAFYITAQSLLSFFVFQCLHCTVNVGDDTYMAGVDRSVVGSDMFMSFLFVVATILVYVVLLSSPLVLPLCPLRIKTCNI